MSQLLGFISPDTTGVAYPDSQTYPKQIIGPPAPILIEHDQPVVVTNPPPPAANQFPGSDSATSQSPAKTGISGNYRFTIAGHTMTIPKKYVWVGSAVIGGIVLVKLISRYSK